ncbi:hypothetical protein B0T45_09270 [Chromobacterium haemolyticum]|uniref:Uncharacterized protein n=2 Tax=Chromobacterium haemolyticum TaxID=394935 RepID=A0A1W0D1Z3_9NEIS|nr:hypothetical protein B0T45_09270 [Chromobacterium haemolyticum]
MTCISFAAQAKEFSPVTHQALFFKPYSDVEWACSGLLPNHPYLSKCDNAAASIVVTGQLHDMAQQLRDIKARKFVCKNYKDANEYGIINNGQLQPGDRVCLTANQWKQIEPLKENRQAELKAESNSWNYEKTDTTETWSINDSAHYGMVKSWRIENVKGHGNQVILLIPLRDYQKEMAAKCMPCTFTMQKDGKTLFKGSFKYDAEFGMLGTKDKKTTKFFDSLLNAAGLYEFTLERGTAMITAKIRFK